MILFSELYKHILGIYSNNTVKIYIYYLAAHYFNFKIYIFSLFNISVAVIFCLNIVSIFFISNYLNAAEITIDKYTKNKHGNIIFLRHALAPGFDAKGKPDDFNIDDCSTQRNLNSVGINQAIELGRIFSESGLTFTKIYSSLWCRCLETARLLKLGKVFPEVSLNSGFRGIYKKDISLKKLSKLLNELKKIDGLFLMVTHYGTISAVTGIVVDSGGAVAYDAETKSSIKILLK